MADINPDALTAWDRARAEERAERDAQVAQDIARSQRLADTFPDADEKASRRT